MDSSKFVSCSQNGFSSHSMIQFLCTALLTLHTVLKNLVIGLFIDPYYKALLKEPLLFDVKRQDVAERLVILVEVRHAVLSG